MAARTGNKSVAAFDLVDKAMRFEKFQRPVDGDRRMNNTPAGHAVDDVIGADGAMVLCHTGQYVAALLGQTTALQLAHGFCPRQQLLPASLVIVISLHG